MVLGKKIGLALLAVASSTAPAAAGDVVPSGPQFQVNAYTEGFQVRPDVAVNADGDGVVVWSSGGIQARAFEGGAMSATPELPVNDGFVLGGGPRPAVVALDDDSFVVAWVNDFTGPIQARALDAGGGIVGPEVDLTDPVADGSRVRHPAMAPADDGGFVLAWATDGFVLSRHVSAAGVLGPVHIVDEAPPPATEEGGEGEAESSRIEVVRGADGRFLAVWSRFVFDGGPFGSSLYESWARSLEASGVPLGDGAFALDPGRVGFAPTIAAAAGGGYLSVWTDYAVEADSFAARALGLDGDALPIAAPLTLSTDLEPALFEPEVAFGADGSFDLVGAPDSDDRVRAQSFDASGGAEAPAELVSLAETGQASNLAIARLPDERLLVVWQSRESVGDDDDFDSIQGRLLGEVPPLFADDFESGDLTGWSEIPPAR